MRGPLLQGVVLSDNRSYPARAGEEDLSRAHCPFCTKSFDKWEGRSLWLCQACQRPLWLYPAPNKAGYRQIFSALDALRFLLLFHVILWIIAILIAGTHLASLTALIVFVVFPFGLIDIVNGILGFTSGVQRAGFKRMAYGGECAFISAAKTLWGAATLALGVAILTA